ncbi:t-SNARE [Serendipita vermifera]|nr:t-SNARE [Serendipita vermifera]
MVTSDAPVAWTLQRTLSHGASSKGGNTRFSGGAVRTPQSPKDTQFLNLQSSLSLNVFKISANVQGIGKLVDQLGTNRDTGNVRKTLHDLTETTRDMIKRGTEDLKQLSILQSQLPHQQSLLKKTSHDFQLAVAAFQNVQRMSAERQRTVVEVVKQTAAGEEGGADPAAARPASPSLQQTQMQIHQLSPQELAHQEALISEREQEIRNIETGIHELNEIFGQLGTIVNQQGTMIDNIESNISSVENDTRQADRELVTAHDYQRKAGRRAACLMIILIVVVTIVLIAILN